MDTEVLGRTSPRSQRLTPTHISSLMNNCSSSDEEEDSLCIISQDQGIQNIDSPGNSHVELSESMGRLYTGQSGSDGDAETDPNMDNTKTLSKQGRFSLNSSISSLVDDKPSEEQDGTVSSVTNDILGSTLPIQRAPMFNIPPPPLQSSTNLLGHHSESSGGYSHHSCGHHTNSVGRDTDSDNNRQRSPCCECQSTLNFSNPSMAPRYGRLTESYCPSCHDNGLVTQAPAVCYTLNHPRQQQRQQQRQQSARMHSRPSTGCGAYEPPWEHAFPSLSQLFPNNVVQQHSCNTACSVHNNMHDPSSCGHEPPCSHSNMFNHGNNTHQGSIHSNSQQRVPYFPRTPSCHDGGPHGLTFVNTLAATSGSHSYETPWDIMPSERHAPPPCSPPPPPPGSLRQTLHYDGAALQHANLIHQLPQKKLLRRPCNWKCIAIFLMVSVIALAACVVTFIVLLLDGQDSCRSSSPRPTGADSIISGSATDGNLGDRHRSEIPPYGFVRMRFYVPQSQFYKFNLTFGSGAMLGVYGQRGKQPTHTQFDFFERLNGQQVASLRNSRSRRATEVVDVNTAFAKRLEEGYLFVSFYNDGDEPQKIRFMASRQENQASDCPKDCHGKGDCVRGVCQCFPGYTGIECALNACPLLCHGNGVYEGGRCHCFDGWKGSECSAQRHHCESCSENGHCVNGECICDKGWRGGSCDQVDCPSTNCSGHGLCYQGQCYCELGHRGWDCAIDEAENFTIACSNDCTGHGKFDSVLQTCSCDAGWHGSLCQNKMCAVTCGPHGQCNSDGRCACQAGWQGVTCSERLCDARCSLHGECNNGTCRCQPGWNGKHCTLNGCINGCSGHGQCSDHDGVWACTCADGWKGKYCSVETESLCDDLKDNDNDNLIDCLDPDCCSHRICDGAPFCQASQDPINILLGKPNLNPMSTFFDSKRFLVEGDSVQRIASINNFIPRRASVLRGQVLFKDGSPALCSRVEVADQPHTFGFTLTRENGIFDLMVNGGGSVTLKIARGSASPVYITVLVPWNKLITLEPVTLLQVTDSPAAPQTCDPGHDHLNLYPIVLPTWQHSQLRACSDRSFIVPESQVIQESLPIEGTDVHLIYKTSDTAGYQSTILIQLTPRTIPANLTRVHLKVTVEGVVFETVFEADPNLTYRFAWARRNAYQQNVYGIVTAQVSVGYQYRNCEKIFWDTQATTLSGFLSGLPSGDLSASFPKGWSLDIQHYYNYQEGILHKGDGTNIYLKEKPRQLVTVVGNGLPRQQLCNPSLCDGSAAAQKLHSPVALASDLDGAVYIADFNMIRKLSFDMRTITSILELSVDSVPYRYFMTVSPKDGMLYLSDRQNKQILKVKNLTPGPGTDIINNSEVVAGSGQVCGHGLHTRCGDGGLAVNAQLTYPAGLAVNKEGELYFVDGVTIRRIRLDNVIETVIGSQDQPGLYVRMPCNRAAELFEVFLSQPTSIAFSPIDGSLHIMDTSTNLILKVTSENTVIVVAGRPTHCPEVVLRKSGLGLLGDAALQSSRARDVDLVALKAMTFAPNGDLFIIESDGDRINRVRVVSTDGYISHYAGGIPPSSCQGESCWDPLETVAAKAFFYKLASLTVTPDGVLYIADMGNRRVHSVVTSLPTPNNTFYSVVSSDEGQLYRFDREGLHVQTRDIMTQSILYNFTMKQRVLTKVLAAGGHYLDFERDNDARLKAIKLNGREVAKVRVNPNNQLQRFADLNNMTSEFFYDVSTGLLRNKRTSKGELFWYNYDETGRLSRIIMPTGEQLSLQANVGSSGAVVTLNKDDALAGTATYNGNSVSLWHGTRSANVTYSNDGSIVAEYPSGLIVTLETGPHPVLGSNTSTVTKRKIISATGGPRHHLEWRYYRRGENLVRVGRKMRVRRNVAGDMHAGFNAKDLMVNGENLLSFEYLPSLGIEVVKTGEDVNLVTALYNAAGLPTFFNSNSMLEVLNITYNSAGQMTSWKQGRYTEERRYTSQGHLESIKSAPDIVTRYLHSNGGSLPTDIFLPSNVQYQLVYDSLGNLMQLVTPAGGRHIVTTSMNLGFMRLAYRFSFGQIKGPAYTEDYNSAGLLVRTQYPSMYRRVQHRYTEDGRLSEIIYGDELIIYEYNSTTYNLISLTLQHPMYQNRLTYRTNGSLFDQHRIEFSAKAGKLQLATAQYSYQYNRLLRITAIEGFIIEENNSSQILNLQFGYSEQTGHVTQINEFIIKRGFVANHYQIALSDSSAQIKKNYDSTNMLSGVEFRIGNRLIHSSLIVYDSMRRITQWAARIDNYQQNVLYVYNSDSNIVQVTVNDGRQHSYAYNGQGSVSQITLSGQTYRVELDKAERVTKFKGNDYLYDIDGFLVSKGNVKYGYNAKGQLTKVLERGRVDVSYFYDAAGRLLVRRDNHGSALQLFYANAMIPGQVTHLYNLTSRLLHTLTYDEDDKLLSINVGSSRYYIMTDPSGTPVAMYDRSGGLMKRLDYSVFGELMFDSQPELLLFIGFQGGFYDHLTKLVLLQERWYDPELGRWLDSLNNVFQRLNDITQNPAAINHHQYQNPINLHLLKRDQLYLKDLRSWLSALGYNLDVLAPKMTFEGQLNGKKVPSSYRALLPLVSAFQCAYEQDMDKFLELSIVPQSKMIRPPAPAQRHLYPSRSMFGDDVILAVEGGLVETYTLGSASTEETILSTSALSGSHALMLNYTVDGKLVFYFVKPKSQYVEDVLNRLDMQSNSAYLGTGLSITVERRQCKDPLTESHLPCADLVITGNDTVFNIRYGSSVEQERRRVLALAAEQAVRLAWIAEQRIVTEGRLSSYPWTSAEINELRNLGKVSGYTWQYRKSADDYPELADDPANIIFTKA